MDKVGIYIDGPNIFHGGIGAGWHINYVKLKNYFSDKYSITILAYYNSLGYKKDKEGNYLKNANGTYIPSEKQLSFYRFLQGQGYRVEYKLLKFINSDIDKPKDASN